MKPPERPDTVTGKIDGVLLHPAAGLVILMTLLFVMFQAVFTWATPVMDGIDAGFAALTVAYVLSQFYRAFLAVLAPVLDVALPDAGFYLWAGVPGGDDVRFALELLAQYNVAVLPGSLLARQAHGVNPGAGRIRLALVAETAECLGAAQRIAQFTLNYKP